VAGKERGKSKRSRVEASLPLPEPDDRWWSEDREFAGWIGAEASPEFEIDETYFLPPIPANEQLSQRVEQIRGSHSLLCQFSRAELRALLEIKRSTSCKAWSLREDLMLLTMHASNRELAELLQDRNKEAVKKRKQLLRSKGLDKRPPPPSALQASTPETAAQTNALTVE
jgi:hypothetical protein